MEIEKIRQQTGFLLMAVATCAALAASFYVAIEMKNETLINMLAGGAMVSFGSFVNFFVGTNKGSERKTEIIAASQPVAVPVSPNPVPIQSRASVA